MVFTSVSNINMLKFTTAHTVPLIQLGILVSSSIVISLSLTEYHLSLSELCCIHSAFTSKPPVLLSHLVSTLNLITATPCTTAFQNLKWSSSGSELYVLASDVTEFGSLMAPKFCHITPIISFLKSLHWLKINERIEYKRLSRSHKLLPLLNLICTV